MPDGRGGRRALDTSKSRGEIEVKGLRRIAESVEGAVTLDDLETELGKTFGKLTLWRVLCQKQNAATEAEKLKIGKDVLARQCTGTVAEAHAYWLEVQGVKSEKAPPYRPTGLC
jgi:hypothetical protein